LSVEGLRFRPDDQQIWETFSPYLKEGSWTDAADQLLRDINRSFWRRKILGWIRFYRRNQGNISDNYNLQWLETAVDRQLLLDGPAIPCAWRDKHFLARSIGTKRVHLLHLFRAVAELRPASVLEVGAGNGLNLISLASRFPNLKLAGIELTRSGVEVTRRVSELDRLPEQLIKFLPEPAARECVAGAIDMRQGDARCMPFGDRSFDMVFTSLALEQMEEVRDAALREIARVTRFWVVMIEPFRDFNDEGIRRRYIQAQDYFSARVGDLTDYGLEPIFVSADMPHKLALMPGVVIARRL